MSVSPESQVPHQDTPATESTEAMPEVTAPATEPAEAEATVAAAPETTAPAQTPEPEEPAQPAEAETEAPAEVTSPAEDAMAPAETTPAAETAAEAARPAEAETEAAAPAEAAQPAPAARPAVPSPGMFAGRKPAAVVSAPSPAPDPTESMKFGRVDESGTVFVTTDEGEQEVGSYPEGTHEEALAYFARKYDELFAQAGLLHTRLEQTEMAAGEAAEGLKKLRASVKDAKVVGDLKALDEKVTAIAAIVSEKSRTEQAEREVARAKAREEREMLVAEAEKIAGQPPARTQWKNSGARMRELLDEWKRQQKEGVRIDKESENALWARFSAARNGFDRARRSWFAELDQQHAGAKATKEQLVQRAEELSSSTDWRSTPGEFRRLMDEWRAAGRASRADDDKLWERFRAAQQRFFDAKDEVVAAENAEYADNLKVKEALLVEAEALLPIQNLDATKKRLGDLQEKWEKAGKVPRADIGRVEGRLKAVEQAVRDAEDKKWKRTNPELKARASSMVEQLEVLVAKCEDELAQATAQGNAKKIAEAEKALAARKAWLEQAQASLQESEG